MTLLMLFLTTLVVSIALSHLTFKYIETPGIQLGRKVSKSIQKRKEVLTGNKVAK